MAPSNTTADPLWLTRIVGLFSLGATTLGLVAVIANAYGPRMIGSGMGYLIGTFGLLGLLLHAFRDPEIEFRRVYGAVGTLLTLLGLLTLLIPGKSELSAAASTSGFYFLPWGALGMMVALGFLAAFTTHETEPSLREWGEVVLLGTGGLLVIATLILGMAKPEALIGNGVVMALVGLGYLGTYLARVDVTVGRGYRAAVGLGVLGVLAMVYALGRSIAPTILYEGPNALRLPNQMLDTWKVIGRVAMILLGLSGLLVTRMKSVSFYARLAAGLIGLGVAILFTMASFSNSAVTTVPTAYLVPNGLILFACGGLFLAVSVSVCSEAPVVVLTRKELSSYFYSPIAYFVIFGTALIAAFGYRYFLGMLKDPRGGAIPEPIVQSFFPFQLGGAITCLFMVPAITMRLFSEERRTGTLEMLLTAPLSDLSIVLSKFFAALAFFMITWLPSVAYLIALRVAGNQPFDYLPVLAFYLALLASGSAFVAMGLFFSSLTKNQIIAAVLTFAGMFAMLLTIARPAYASMFGEESAEVVSNVLAKFDFLSLWSEALSGRLSITNVVAQVSFCVLWLFLTLKVLEARKWS